MAYAVFVFGGKLGIGLDKSVRNKDRIIAKAVGTTRRLGKSSRADTLREIFNPITYQSENGSKLRIPSARWNPPHFLQQLFIVLLVRGSVAGIARRTNSRASVPIEHFKSGIVCQGQQLRMLMDRFCFLERVLLECGTIFHEDGDIGKILERKDIERKIFEEGSQLIDLVTVPAGEDEFFHECGIVRNVSRLQ